jgi:predicted enzyme related to lactoylglutathione lyase
VDGTAEAAVRAGGSIVKEPSDMAGAGRYAVLKDPQGAVFAVIDPENARPESTGVPPLGSFAWHELATSDNEAAFAFYSGLFGWDAIARMDIGPTGIYLIFGENGIQRGGMYLKPPENPGPPSWLPYAHVPNADESFQTALASGAKGTVPPMEVPGGSRVANLVDPAGADFAVHSMPKVGPMAVPPAKPKAVARVKAKATPKPKPKPRKKAAPAKKKSPARKKAAKKVARKSVGKVVRKVAKKAARKKSKTVRRKK